MIKIQKVEGSNIKAEYAGPCKQVDLDETAKVVYDSVFEESRLDVIHQSAQDDQK